MIQKILKRIRSHHFREIIVYGIVGLSALAGQNLVYLSLIEFTRIFPSVAMAMGTGFGMVISYAGHVIFTFKKGRFSKREFSKFVMGSLIGLSINVLGVRIITKVLELSPEYGIIPTFITPLITFLISKFWVFR